MDLYREAQNRAYEEFCDVIREAELAWRMAESGFQTEEGDCEGYCDVLERRQMALNAAIEAAEAAREKYEAALDAAAEVAIDKK